MKTQVATDKSPPDSGAPVTVEQLESAYIFDKVPAGALSNKLLLYITQNCPQVKASLVRGQVVVDTKAMYQTVIDMVLAGVNKKDAGINYNTGYAMQDQKEWALIIPIMQQSSQELATNSQDLLSITSFNVSFKFI